MKGLFKKHVQTFGIIEVRTPASSHIVILEPLVPAPKGVDLRVTVYWTISVYGILFTKKKALHARLFKGNDELLLEQILKDEMLSVGIIGDCQILSLMALSPCRCDSN